MEFFGDAQKMKQMSAVSWLWNESESELVGGEKVNVSWLWKESESELVVEQGQIGLDRSAS